jgi:beta-1,4-mannosyltransferase
MSSSGVDLPMKVVDMFGSGLPVVGYSGYESWSELVRERENGRGFRTSEELGRLLVELFGESGQETQLEILRCGAVKEGKRRWDDEWDEVAGRVLGLCD